MFVSAIGLEAKWIAGGMATRAPSVANKKNGEQGRASMAQRAMSPIW